MTPQYAATVFHVTNVDESIKYYIGVLGFSLDFRYNDLAGMVYAHIVVYLSGPKQDLKKATGEGSMYIVCDEVDVYYQSISGKGAIIQIPLNNRPYDMRDFAISDPDGNTLTFGQNL